MTVNTKQVDRRSLHYRSVEEFRADLDLIETAQRAGTLDFTGNWTPAQNLSHLAIFGGFSLDGFPFKAPAPIRWMAQLFFKRKAVAGGVPPAGLPLKKKLAVLVPDPSMDFDEAMGRLRGVLDRIDAGEAFVPTSPLFGALTREQWINLHLGHASLHMSFLRPGESAASG